MRTEIDRLTSAIASGGQMKSLLKALQAREEERERLRRQVVSATASERRAAATPSTLRQDLTARFMEWRDVLRRQPTQARQILKKLLEGPLRLTPKDGYYEFEGSVSWTKIFETASLPILVASPQGFEPWFQP